MIRQSIFATILLPVMLVLPMAAVFPGEQNDLRTNLLQLPSDDGTIRPISKKMDWEKRRQQILKNMQKVMGALPKSPAVELDMKCQEEVITEKFVRKLIDFSVDGKDRVPAYLFIPRNLPDKTAAVLCLHPTSRPHGKKIPAGLEGKSDRHYAKELAERGYVTLAPDYPNMGGYEYNAYENGYASTTMKGIVNHRRCVDLLQSLPQVDDKKIGVIGHSLGGHNSMFLAVFDERIQCTVSNCGFCSFPRYYKGNLAGWSHDGYMPRIKTVYGLDPKKMPFDFTEVVAAIAPRPFLASAPIHDDNFDVQGVKECISAARPVYQLLNADNKLAANYPDCGHDFPNAPRHVAYRFLDRWLKNAK